MDLFVDREEDDGEGEVLVRLMWLGELFSVCSNHCKTPTLHLSVVIVLSPSFLFHFTEYIIYVC